MQVNVQTSWPRLSLLSVTASVIGLCAGAAAMAPLPAASVTCTVDTPSLPSYICSGDLSGGILVQPGTSVPSNLPSNVQGITVNNPTTNLGGLIWNPRSVGWPALDLDLGQFIVDGSVAVAASLNVATGAAATTSLNISAGGINATDGIGVLANRFGLKGVDRTGNTEVGGAGSPGGNVAVSFKAVPLLSELPIVVTRQNVSSSRSGISAYSTGGDGGKGGLKTNKGTGSSGQGGAGGNIFLNPDDAYVLIDSTGHGIWAYSAGGNTPVGADGKGFNSAGNSGSSGAGGNIAINGDQNGAVGPLGGAWDITTFDDGATGILMQTYGGNVGKGGNAANGSSAFGGNAGNGGNGGNITIYDTAPVYVTTNGDNASGISAISAARSGGMGGDGNGSGRRGSGGNGGHGGAVTLDGVFGITTNGVSSDGIVAASTGGAGGATGTKGGTNASPGSAGAGGAIEITAAAGSDIQINGDNSTGIAAQSIGGRGADGSSTKGLVSFGLDAGSANAAGTASITNHGTVTTKGTDSTGIMAHSIGGGGGHGGATFGLFYGKGGSGSQGGSGNNASVTNTGTVTTDNHASIGVLVQSIGGTGGSGGSSGGMVALGGGATGGGSGAAATVTNRGTVKTGLNPSALRSQSSTSQPRAFKVVRTFSCNAAEKLSGHGWANRTSARVIGVCEFRLEGHQTAVWIPG